MCFREKNKKMFKKEKEASDRGTVKMNFDQI